MTIDVTARIRAALVAIEQAEDIYRPGLDESAVIELPKLALADAVLAAVRAQQADRVARLPVRVTAAPAGVALAERPKRRRS